MHRYDEHVAGGYVLIQAQAGRLVADLAERVGRVPGIARAERVHGAYDVVARISQEGPAAPNAAETIRRLDGVLRAIVVTTRAKTDRPAA